MFGKFDLWTLAFMGLGIFMTFIWPAAIRRKIEDGEASEDAVSTSRYLRGVGIPLLIYCLVEILWQFLPHGPK